MEKKTVVREDNDSLFFIKYLNSLGYNQRKLSRLLNCSNVVNHWAMGYRKIPRAFLRFMLVIKFIHELNLLPELLEYIKLHEKGGWGSPEQKKTNWLEFQGVDTKLPKKRKIKRRRK